MATIHLFIDTNVFLNFYSFTNDGLDQLVRLTEVVDAGNVCLHLPQQVVNELARNREQKIKLANEQFLKESLPTSIPRHLHPYAQSGEYVVAIEQAKTLRKKLISLAVADASNQTLQPDVLLRALFEKAEKYPEDNGVFGLALQRMQKGNPPGKNGSVGDQYNWEILLKEVPDADLYIVSKDGDYVSVLNSSRPHPFLEIEWKEKKGSALHIFPELKAFLDRHQQMLEQPVLLPVPVPPVAAGAEPGQVNIPVEAEPVVEPVPDVQPGPDIPQPNEPVADEEKTEEQLLLAKKDEAVNALATSYSFAVTHAAISRIKHYQHLLNKTDAEYLIKAAVNNEQIRWIATDSDVYAFFSTLLTEHSDIDTDLFEEAADVFGLRPEPTDPFDG